jgi:predicted Zn-dependent protease
VRSPDELAGVLAHEMQHVLERHVTEGMFKQLGLTVVVGVLADVSGLGAGTAAARALGELSYSRDAELEADTQGLRTLIAVGGDPEAMASVLERMGAQQRTPGTLEFLSTHPDPAARARRLRAMAAETARASTATIVDETAWNELKAAVREKR